MRARVLLAVLLVLVAVTSRPRAQMAPQAPVYRVVVHPHNPATSLERQFVEDAFLKRRRAWPHDATVRPADLPPQSHVRVRFSEEIIRRPVSAVRAYWQQRIFSGRDVPPPELASDAEVMRYVANHPGGIGYVSGGAALVGVKAVPVR